MRYWYTSNPMKNLMKKKKEKYQLPIIWIHFISTSHIYVTHILAKPDHQFQKPINLYLTIPF